MELGPEPPHRRRLLFTCSPTPAPQPTGKVLFGASAAGGLSPVTNLTVTMDQLEGLGSDYEKPMDCGSCRKAHQATPRPVLEC
ncbi:cell division cycle 25 homolog A (S. cerevisiae), isoform CRA_b [Rattus norvegicus]|uniref:Cell division cycle 25 homolog A (S. cerevisiae), isoform CRA_b n=1 Tax=Rattus norvegicus TaxID=10116 RepID=A6I3C8_RAT|nr:cell division cycle 25 homolog A (S. cerevisiae), isoform CRA_b [Rattus norvegicus]